MSPTVVDALGDAGARCSAGSCEDFVGIISMYKQQLIGLTGVIYLNVYIFMYMGCLVA